MMVRWAVGVAKYVGAIIVLIVTMAAYLWPLAVPYIVEYCGYEWPWWHT
jgi:hypothetical protein